jgi:hypothetical protein
MKIPQKIARLLLLSAGLLGLAAQAAPMTNADVIKLLQAQLDEGIILTAIENSEPKFDTSATGLIELSNAKVPKTIITAMMKKANGPAPAVAAAPATPAAEAVAEKMSPSEVFMIDGTETKQMRYLNPQVRTAARGLGFGGIASYAVLRNSAASGRTKNKTPSFLISVPNQAQPESYVTLASFAVRQNNSREVLIGGGYMSYSTGIHPDRVVPIRSEKAGDQSRAEKGFTIYKVTPGRNLAAGEYAVILYTGEMHGTVGAWFSGTGNSYFDFGVDP